MSKNQILSWHETDSQLLEALLLATGGEGGAPLQEVLLMCDALEGTVLSLQEVEAGLLKLIAAGFITLQKNKFTLTPEFLQAYEAKTLQEGADATADSLMQLLQQQELTAEKLEAISQGELKKYKLKNHYQQYLEQFG